MPGAAAREENVRYFRSAAEAAQGFRPCLRCRPESAPWSPAWLGTDTTVRRALDLINEGYLNHHPLSALAARLGVGERYLRKLFEAQLGVPSAVAQTQRLHFAKKLLLETDLPMTDIAFAAGFGSVRRFNSATRDAFGCPPGELRKRSPKKGPVKGMPAWTPQLTGPPMTGTALLDLFARHTVTGIESVEDGRWTGALRDHRGRACIAVSLQRARNKPCWQLRLTDNRDLMPVVATVRRMFDLDAQPADIAEHLAGHPALAPLVAIGRASARRLRRRRSNPACDPYWASR